MLENLSQIQWPSFCLACASLTGTLSALVSTESILILNLGHPNLVLGISVTSCAHEAW